LLRALRSQIAFSADIGWSEQPDTNQSNIEFFPDPFYDHLDDRLKMLLLSNRQSDIGVSRDIWLAVTITTFAGMVAGITLFFLSYQSRASRIANSK
jgi:hypothetical protein